MFDVRPGRTLGGGACSHRRLVPTTWAVAFAVATLVGLPQVHGQVAVRGQGFVPYAEPPINYLSDEVNDPVARLQARLEKNEVSLKHDPRRGYLDSVLEALAIPVSSQALVFSKTSFQYRKISPRSPRALYFNDDVYVGWVQGGDVLEIASFDPRQGAIFYLLDQSKADSPTFLRAELDCTQCHVAAGTRGIPGVLVRSIRPTITGTQALRTESIVAGHETPIGDRFGGWYVTGSAGSRVHLGNAFVRDREHPEALERFDAGNPAGVPGPFPAGAYLSNHSDIVAQLVLAHQTQAHNLITLVNYKTRLALHADKARAKAEGRPPGDPSPAVRLEYEKPAEELLRYLLFADEAPLDGPVAGSSGFAEQFVARGPRDSSGRSLRDLDLSRRLFKYPCSYLIYSNAFDAIPEPAKGYLYRRLREVLTGPEPVPGFERLSASDRRAVLAILEATKPNLPDDWSRPMPNGTGAFRGDAPAVPPRP